MRRSIPISLGPLLLPIGIPKNGPPFLGSEGWEAALGAVLDFIEEQEIMIIVNTLG